MRSFRALFVVAIITLCAVLAVREHLRGNEIAYELNQAVSDLKTASRRQRDLRYDLAKARAPEKVLAAAARTGIRVHDRKNAEVLTVSNIKMRRIMDEFANRDPRRSSSTAVAVGGNQ